MLFYLSSWEIGALFGGAKPPVATGLY